MLGMLYLVTKDLQVLQRSNTQCHVLCITRQPLQGTRTKDFQTPNNSFLKRETLQQSKLKDIHHIDEAAACRQDKQHRTRLSFPAAMHAN